MAKSSFGFITNNVLTEETLALQHQPYVNGPIALFPMDTENGPQDVLDSGATAIEKNIGYDTLLTPLNLLGSPMFSGGLYPKSYMKLDLSKVSNQPTDGLTIMAWVRPASTNHKVLFVSFSVPQPFRTLIRK